MGHRDEEPISTELPCGHRRHPHRGPQLEFCILRLVRGVLGDFTHVHADHDIRRERYRHVQFAMGMGLH